jgi:hypothetical protein
LAKFKSLKDMLLSHNGADGGLDREPGRIELLDYEGNGTPSPDLEDGDDGEDEYLHPKTCCPWALERAERDLRDFRNKNVALRRNDVFRR